MFGLRPGTTVMESRVFIGEPSGWLNGPGVGVR